MKIEGKHYLVLDDAELCDNEFGEFVIVGMIEIEEPEGRNR